MQKMHDSLRHASKEGRLEFLQTMFKLFADLHSDLEDKIVEKQENLDRAIWLYTRGDRREAWIKICEDDLADAQTEIANFLSLLWEIKETFKLAAKIHRGDELQRTVSARNHSLHAIGRWTSSDYCPKPTI